MAGMTTAKPARPRLSPRALNTLAAACEHPDGLVSSTRQTIGTLMVAGYVEHPRYDYGRGRPSRATITAAGRERVAAEASR
jgi:hypothetical protein